MTHVTETFFLPEAIDSVTEPVTPEIYNLTRTLLKKSDSGYVFVPIRNMQHMAILSKREVVFVDSHSYAYNESEGGRVIVLMWTFKNIGDRGSIDDPVDCEITYYRHDSHEIHLRLFGEFRKALISLIKHYRDAAMPAEDARVINLR